MAIYFMALHPDLCETLREEVLKTHGHEENPTYESIKGMPYRTLPIRIPSRDSN